MFPGDFSLDDRNTVGLSRKEFNRQVLGSPREQNYRALVETLRSSKDGIRIGFYDESNGMLELLGPRFYKVTKSKHRKELLELIEMQIRRGVIKKGRITRSKRENNFVNI